MEHWKGPRRLFLNYSDDSYIELRPEPLIVKRQFVGRAPAAGLVQLIPLTESAFARNLQIVIANRERQRLLQRHRDRAGHRSAARTGCGGGGEGGRAIGVEAG